MTTMLQADILMVTDGEISPPSDTVLDRLARAREDLGLQVTGGSNYCLTAP